MTEMLTEDQGKQLVRLAREVIEHRLGVRSHINRKGLEGRELQRSCGCFVTLKMAGQLRGCIGNLEGVGSLVDAVERNAVSAALHDFRFIPLSVDELSRIHIDVSVLTPAVPLHYRDSAELLNRIRPGVDGVIVQLGSRRATFLPQVWEQLPEPERFLDQLCLKAGLEKTSWRTVHPEIFIYQATSYSE